MHAGGAGRAIDGANALETIGECRKAMALRQWAACESLYSRIAAYHDTRGRARSEPFPDDDPFNVAWGQLRASLVDSILRNIEGARHYDEFLDWTKRLSKIVPNPRQVWNLLHTEVQPSLKVSFEQSHEFAAHFFNPVMLFEFGLDSFLESSLCSLAPRASADALVDAFYALAGYVRVCRLGGAFRIRNRAYVQFVIDLLVAFARLPRCPMRRFVWLVECVARHLQLSGSSLRRVCEAVVREFCERADVPRPLVRLQQLTVLSTSPSLAELPTFRASVEAALTATIQALVRFTHRYVFSCYVTCYWLDAREEGLSDAVRAWRIFFATTLARMREMELPESYVVQFVDMNLSFMNKYYGDVQASRVRAADLRREVFVVVDLIVGAARGRLPREMLETVWLMLMMTAVSGAEDAQLARIETLESPEPDTPWLALEHTDADWVDYGMALGRLMKKFDAELSLLPEMISWIRKNYTIAPLPPKEYMRAELARLEAELAAQAQR
jgi:hypothetical protein